MDIKKKILKVTYITAIWGILTLFLWGTIIASIEFDPVLSKLCFLGNILLVFYIWMWESADAKHPNLCTIMTGMIINLSWIFFPDIYSDFKVLYSVESLQLTVMILILSLTVQFIVGNDKEITAGARTYFTSNLLLVIYCLFGSFI
jgi:hypothetical protein